MPEFKPTSFTIIPVDIHFSEVLPAIRKISYLRENEPRKLSLDPADQETISFIQPELPALPGPSYTIRSFPTQVEQQILCMSEDTALVHYTIEELCFYRVIAPSDDPGIWAIPTEQIKWPEDATFMDLFCSGGMYLGARIKYLVKE